jgi:hypothetical protein
MSVLIVESRMRLQHWMNLHKVSLLLVLGFVAVAETGSAADSKGPLVPDSDYPKLVKRLSKGITDALKDGKPSEEQAAKAQAAAVVIASAAQQRLDGTDGQQRATVRDVALNVVDAIKANKFAYAAQLAETLPTLKEHPLAKKEKVKIDEKYIAFPDLMHQFRPLREGGWGIYGHLQRLQTKQYTTLPREEVNEAFTMEANHIALTADLALGVAPKGKPKEFTKNLENMRQSATELADALRDKEAAKVAPPALSKLTTTCFGCHRNNGVK